MTPLQEFYRGRVIFITGVTGFLGKVLLYKLLLSCPDIRGIIVLLRSKNGKTCSERLSNIFSGPEFSALARENLKKVSYISADILQPELGLTCEDRDMLLRSQVSVVFHIAATVRFNEHINTAVNTNVLPVLSLLRLCKEMPQLEALVYVSTAYSQCPQRNINEKIYCVPVDLRHLVHSPALHMETLRKPDEWPNTYTFSKAIAEKMIEENNNSLPVAIFRPSIVINAWKEPKPGWIDNINGPIRILRSIYIGRTRCGLFNYQKMSDLVPVDMCANALIAIAWEAAHSCQRGQVKIYNFVTSVQNPITWGQYWTTCGQHITDYPALQASWYYCFVITKYWLIYFFLWFCLELIPAFLIDVLQWCKRRTRRHISSALASIKYTKVVSYFSTREWIYQDTNMRILLGKMMPEDRELFNFDVQTLKWNTYLRNCVKGIREYILREDSPTLLSARKRYYMLYILHCALQICFLYLWYRFLLYILTG